MSVRFYPALQAEMGMWTYYTIIMRMKDVVREVQFASKFNEQEDQVEVLGDARQRALATNRVRKQIVEFLMREKRFFSSLVVATKGGRPVFCPIKVEQGTVACMFADTDIDKSFGILRLDDSHEIYALDGQHRLAAIKFMLNKDFQKKMGSENDANAPEGFEDEVLSVIMVVPRAEKSEEDFKIVYRQLFTSLNRHAKKTDRDTDIIMDEDDVYATLTRRLISEHEFFQDAGRPESESEKVKMKGAKLSDADPHFIPLQTLYDANKTLMRGKRNWENRAENFPEFYKEPYEELSDYWDAILRTFPDFREEPKTMRPFHMKKCHLFFRPIGQKMMANLVRFRLNNHFSKQAETVGEMHNLIASMSEINWDLLAYPWKGMLAIPSDLDGEYVMRDEQRTRVVRWATKCAKFMLRWDSMSESEEKALKEEWSIYMTPRPNDDEIDDFWNKNIKPVLPDRDTDIMMDKNDVYAILTRRLISEHEFFQDAGRSESKSEKVKMKGANLKDEDPHFIPLQTLYYANKTLLINESRRKRNWKNRANEARPGDKELEELYKELSSYWDAILLTFPDFREEPTIMRTFDKEKRHLFFRPIGQKMMADLVRLRLDKNFSEQAGTVDEMHKLIASMSKINWDLLAYPWKGMLATPKDREGEYIMRDEQSDEVVKWAAKCARFMLGWYGMSESREKNLKKEWRIYMTPRPNDDDIDDFWNKNIKPVFPERNK